MYLTRRDIIAWVLLFAASVCFLFGVALANDPKEIDAFWRESDILFFETSTAPMEAGSQTATTVTWITGLETTTVTGISLNEPDTSQDAAPSDVEDLVEDEDGDYYGAQKHPLLKRVVGVMLCAGTACMTAVAVFVLWQRYPVLGPDGVCFLLGAAQFVSLLLKGQQSDLPSVGEIAWRSLWRFVLVFVILISIRELVCWGGNKLSSDCFLIRRIGNSCKRPQFAILAFVLWILLALGGCAVVVGEKMQRGDLQVLSLICFGTMAGGGVLCVWKYGADFNHFKTQLANYQKGLPIAVGNGAFSEIEAQLLDVRSEHEVAVRAAVVSERFKVELISNVSHDLRTPLTSILGYGELLENEELSSEGREQLKKLNMKAGYMNELVESIFELTKVSSGDLPPKMAEIDLVCLLEQTVGFFDDRLATNELVVRRHYEKESLPVVTDGTRMHRVFSNLLGNAIKYAMKGTRIYIDVSEAGDRYQIRMLNTASYEMDFDSDEIVRRFARGDKARSTNGSGLGLAIAKTYTESVGGEFFVTVDGDQFCAVTELPKTVRDL